MNLDARRDKVIPSFSNALVGHLVIGVLKAVPVALLIWLCGVAGLATGVDISTAVVVALGASFCVEVAATAVERPAVVKHQHSEPGGVARAIAVAACAPVFGAIVPIVVLQSLVPIVIAVAAVSLCNWVFLIFVDRLWKRGETLEDFRARHDAVKKMTEETFGRGMG